MSAALVGRHPSRPMTGDVGHGSTILRAIGVIVISADDLQNCR